MPDAKPARYLVSQYAAAKRLDCSVAQVQRFIADGSLHAYPQRKEGHFKTRVCVDADEVVELDKKWIRKKRNGKRTGFDPERGRLAHIVFSRYFGAGCFDLRKIVSELAIDPALVRDLYREWLVSLDAFLTAEQEATSVERERRAWNAHDRKNEKGAKP